MLLAIRERAKGIVAWVVIILIAAAFAAFGLANYMEPAGSPRAVATVDGTDISPDEVNRVYRQQRAELEEMLGDRFDPSLFSEEELRRDALDRVIEERLLAEFIDKHKLRLSDGDLAVVIRSQEVFHENGRFSSERYQQLLQANRLSSSQYERQVRRGVLMDQLRGAISDTALVPDQELDRLLALQNQERDLAYLRISGERLLEGVEIDDDAVRGHYEANQDNYLSDERVRLGYLELREDQLLTDVEVDEEEVRARYEQFRDTRFTETETREVRHILLNVDADADSDTVEGARERLEGIRQRIADGESFAELAEEYSEDSGTAGQGGDLGELEAGDLHEDFDAVAFELDEGELSDLVRTPFGFHLIEVTAIRGGETRDFDEVRDTLARELAEERVGNLFFEQSSLLDELIFDWPDSLEPAAEELGLELRTSDWVTRDGAEDGIGAHSAVVEAAFSDDVLEARQNSELLEIDDGHYIVVRIDEHEPPEQLAFEEVEGEIREQLKRRAAMDEARELADSLRQRLQDGEDPESLADEYDVVRLDAPGFVDRDSGAPWSVLEAAFTLERPVEGEVRTGLAEMGGGDLAVVMVRAVRDGETEDLDAEDRDRLKDQLRMAYGDDALLGLVRSLRAEADIEIFEDRL
ncbi:SurA N-terminal domain-containing protein [Methylonatrum kenyense]|uniref:SurA N-terminal domain-containing protein n=1 Tax=Methylonatrum kenyense TaxID=455253 RepID=UPI0020C00719|nr:SurA N-terminal domain-containing protein [Methylonatrum kenyense]MCK8515516.1 SurA N-terminal domain-containing protein [Methylonatrum kenyense]